jgi:hypothetical protein
MPNGEFKYLLNYIDHGIKFLFSIPLKRKRASCIAVALLEIFTVIGPPMILQSNNGKEFSSVAMTTSQRSEINQGRCEGLPDELLIEVIDEIKKLWPDCHMVWGSACHSVSNGGVECVNRTMEEKLGAWMGETGNSNWSIGCRLMMWRYNTQIHRTIDDVPYNLLFGHMPRVGISNLPLANELINTLATEAQLNRVCDYVGKVGIPDDNDGDGVLLGQQGDNNQDTPMASNESDPAVVVVGEIGEIGSASDNESGIPLATIVDDPDLEPAIEARTNASSKKTAEAEEDNNVSRWQVAVENIPNDFTLESLNDIRLRASIPVAWCKDVNNIADQASFVPAYLTRISKHEWEVSDEDDIPLTSLDWDGDEGLENLVGCGYIQYPTMKFVHFFRSVGTTGAISTIEEVAEEHAVSPKRAALHSRAASKQETSAKKMIQTAITKMGGQENVFLIGNIVQVPVSDVDKAKVDNYNLTGVIAKIDYSRLAVRVVVKAGLLQSWYQYHR